MPKYLVELYLPGSSAETRDAVAATARGGGGDGVTYLRSIFLPEEETCFHEYECSSARVLAEALARAEVPYQRLTEAHVVV